MEWVPGGGSRNTGRPTKTWRKSVKEDLADMEINWNYAPKLLEIVPNGKSSSPDVRKGQDELSLSLSKSSHGAVAPYETNHKK